VSIEIKILSLNVHKGFDFLNRKFTLEELRECIREEGSDLVFLQEVQGEHQLRQKKLSDWPQESHYEFLADQIWSDFAYGKNAVYPEGHHGNAILSKYPIEAWQNEDVSAHRVEKRGILYCQVSLIEGMSLHAFCVHFGLLKKFRRYQTERLADLISKIPKAEPLLVAGDFNDWNGEISKILERACELKEASTSLLGRPSKTFPSFLPVASLDRIYSRGLECLRAGALRNPRWASLSDHLPLVAQFRLLA